MLSKGIRQRDVVTISLSGHKKEWLKLSILETESWGASVNEAVWELF